MKKMLRVTTQVWTKKDNIVRIRLWGCSHGARADSRSLFKLLKKIAIFVVIQLSSQLNANKNLL